MAEPATDLQSPSSTARAMEFEQPLTERMRTFLRIELLHQQALFHAEDPTELRARAAVSSLLEVLTILGRGDVRAEIIKVRKRQGEILASFTRQPGVDPARLQGLVDEAIGAGALGFSTSRTYMHKVPDGRCVPGSYADSEEMRAIGRVLGKHGKGIFESPIRDASYPGS